MSPAIIIATMNFPGKSHFKRNLAVFLFSFVIVNVVIVTLAGEIARWYSIRLLSQHGIDADFGQVQIDLLDSRLNITDFKVNTQKQRFSFKQVSVDWQWDGIFDKQVTIDNVQIDGLRLDVTATDGKLAQLGPIELAKFFSDGPKAPAEPFSYRVSIGPVRLLDFDICYVQQVAQQAHCAKWDVLALATQTTIASNAGPVVSGDIMLEGLAAMDGLRVAQFQLKGMQFEGEALSWQMLDIRDMHYDKSPLEQSLASFNLAKGLVNVNRLDVKAETLSLSGSQTRVDGYVGELNGFNVDDIEVLSGKSIRLGSVSLSGLNAMDGERQWLSVSRLSTADIKADLADRSGQVKDVSLAQMQLNQISARGSNDKLLTLEQLTVERVAGDVNSQQLSAVTAVHVGLMQDLSAAQEQMLVSLNALDVDKVSRAGEIEVGTVTLKGLVAALDLQPQTGLNLANWLPKTEGEKAQKSDSSDKTTVTIHRVQLGEGSKVSLGEYSLGQKQHHEFSEIALDISPVILGGGSKPANVALSAKINGSGELVAKGQVTPEPDNLSVNMSGTLKYLSLPEYSPYSARHIGYRIDQGQLNVDYKINLKDNQIDSNFELLLSKFELGNLQQYEKSPVNQELGVPLPTALDLIRDSDDNIELSIPVKGDLNSPDFSVSGVVSTVTLKAVKTAVLYTYSPLGFLSVAGELVNLATALRFKPIEFEPGKLVLTETAKSRLDKTAAVLKNKNKVSLVLCANATKADLPPETPFAEIHIPELLEKATARQKIVQSYLVEQQKIAPHRLLTCNVKLDKKATAKPVVKLSI